MTFSYCLLETPIPLFNYVAHVRLMPVTDGDRTFWHWESRFTRRRARRPRCRAMVGEEIYQAGFAAIRRDLEPAGLRNDATMPIARQDLRPASARPPRALAADRGARFLAGGTLVMRAVNEGDLSISTDRARDRPRFRRDPPGRRARHARRRRHHGADPRQPRARLPAPGRARGRRAGGAQRWRPSAAICSRPRPTATSPPRCSRSTPRSRCRAATAARETPLEEFLRDARARRAALVASVTLNRPASPDAFRFRKVVAGEAEGHLGALDRGPPAAVRRAHRGRARRLRRDGADAAARQGGRARARRPSARRRRHRRGRSRSRPRASTRRPTPSPAPGTGARWPAVHLRRLLWSE